MLMLVSHTLQSAPALSTTSNRGACLHILQLGLGNMSKNSYICIFSYQSISIITINVKFLFLSSLKADFCEICRNKTINFP